MRATLEDSPDDTSTRWTTRALADRFGIGKDTVARIWRDHHLKLWKVDTCKASNDSRFEEKVVDVLGLYMNPPERAAAVRAPELRPAVQVVPGPGHRRRRLRPHHLHQEP